jgi:hypothetical protein
MKYLPAVGYLIHPNEVLDLFANVIKTLRVHAGIFLYEEIAQVKRELMLVTDPFDPFHFLTAVVRSANHFIEHFA